MTPRPPTHREPTDEEMQCLPEGTLYWDAWRWAASTMIGERPNQSLKSDYAVPITKQEEVKLSNNLCPACGTAMGINPVSCNLSCPHIACCYTTEITIMTSTITDTQTTPLKHPNPRLVDAASDLLEALQAEEKRQWALRNLEGISDPLDPRLPAYRFEVERTSHEANTLRRAAIAKATKPEADAMLAARNNQPEKV